MTRQILNTKMKQSNMIYEDNYKKVDLKRKRFSKKRQNFKRYKKLPKCVRDNPENQVARQIQKDAYHFTDSEEEGAYNDLGMGIDISELPFLDDNHSNKQKDLIALTQDTVRPLFTNDSNDVDDQLNEGLLELRYSEFRGNQKETVRRILSGQSTLFISPTGSGKSLCYQLPALLYWRYKKYMTIVVSPLISLMEDQMSNFPASLKAVSLHSGHSNAHRQRSIEKLVNHEAQVAFISPEAIVGGVLSLEDLKNLPPVGFVCIDEAHCLSEWSHNFRPAYLQFFRILNDQMNIKTYLGLTATATKSTSQAIARHLRIDPERDIVGSTRIPDNLILSVSYETNKEQAIIKLLKSPTFRIMTSIIIYCNRREETENLASSIRTAMRNYCTMIDKPERKSKSFNSKDDSMRSDCSDSALPEKAQMKLPWDAQAYHAGLSSETRTKIQRQFVKGEIRVVVATIAFGMGINKSNVKAIIHYDMPSSFESYVQEIGRAGRDGKLAQCHTFLKADRTDLFYLQRNIYSSITEPRNLKKITEYLFKKSCLCLTFAKQEVLEELEAKNQSDPHEITTWQESGFASVPVCDNHENPLCGEDDELGQKENYPVILCRTRASVVRKHRVCKTHEVAFSIDKAVDEINLRAESIITLICQLQQAYPQLNIIQYTPMKSKCNLLCYRGPTQLESLRKTCPAVRAGLLLCDRKEVDGSACRISFDIIKVAKHLSKESSEVISMLKKTEWELVEKTGRFRRSQVRVNFEGNSFHLRAVHDLDDKEIEEINESLKHFTQLYESIERNKLVRVFDTFKQHSISVEQMENRATRLEISSKLKASLNAYFDETSEAQLPPTVNDSLNDSLLDASQDGNAENLQKKRAKKEKSIRTDARDFIAAHGNSFSPRTIARIFQGIPTPNYPAEHWGMNKKWWRIHLDVDFLYLVKVIQDESFAHK